MLHEEITSDIISAFFEVYNTLGSGFLEKVYENALVIELESRGHAVRAQAPVRVAYAGRLVGDYFADLVVDERVIVEVKAADQIVAAHEAQLINYLRATGIEVGLLLNFGPQAKFKRKIYTRRDTKAE